MVSVCLPSDALLQHLPSFLGFSYLGLGVSLHLCSSKAQPLLLTLDKGYLLTAALSDLQRGIAPLGPPAPAQPGLLGLGVAPPLHGPWPWAWGVGYLLPAAAPDLGTSDVGYSLWPPPFRHGVLPASAPDLGRGVAPLGCTLACPSQPPGTYKDYITIRYPA